MCRLYFSLICLLLITSSTFASLSVDTVVKRIRINRELLNIGIISDAQFPENDENLSVGHWGGVMNGPKHVHRALNYFKKMSVDMIIMNGDMVNSPSGGNAYNTYNMLLDDVYGKERTGMPLLIYPMGNHEFYSSNAENLYKDNVELPLNSHYVVNGIHFIGVSCSDGNGGYTEDRLEYLRHHLEIAYHENKTNPIIVISHMPFKVDNFFGGQWESPQAKEFYQILSAYPQVVYLCGHSHYPLFDDLSVIQKDFTIINTGSTSYFDLDWNTSKNKNMLDKDLPNEYENPQLIGIFKQADIDGRDEVNQGWIMDLNSRTGNINLRRMNYDLSRQFGYNIVLQDLYRRNFTYTEAQMRANAKSPYFKKGSHINCFVCDDGVVDICFNSASPDVLTKHYMMIITDPDGNQKKIRFLAKGYYQGFDLPYMEHVRYYGSKKKGKYQVKIKAVSCLGKESSFLQSDYMF